MKEQAEKLLKVEKEISDEKGPFELFALFLREDAPGKWDLLISAEWAQKSKKEAIGYIVSKIREVLSNEEVLMLSRIIIVEKEDNALKAIHQAMQVEHSIAEIKDSNFFGLAIKHAFLITSKRHSS